MINNPSEKYRPFKGVDLPDRQWPSATIEKPPIWMSTDLRDGNQALIDPLSVPQKIRMFKELVDIGFKEIEVAFPAASETDFQFVRQLIEENMIPDDVTIEVLTQARRDLIERTIESVRGAKRVIVHVYNPTAESFRRMVYKTDKAGCKEIAENGTRWIKEITDQIPETEWVFQYSPEMFSATEIDFAKEVIDAVSEIWSPTPENKMIINLPATVEMAGPNTFADQVEWIHRNIERRDSITISVHPHNDRGTAVAAAELAVMAGADRVEGCLFGHGERTGNVDLVTLAMNLYSQGIHPGLDFSDIDRIKHTVEELTNIDVHPRHPYAGELVFTAFSGSHQDAIKKGFALQDKESYWEVPYLPIDPADVNRSYEAVVRVNSQSGKGGIAFVLQQEYGYELPRRLQMEFSKVVQQFTDETGREAKAADLHELFQKEYLQENGTYQYQGSSITEPMGEGHDRTEVAIKLTADGEEQTLVGHGAGTVEAAIDALGVNVSVVDYHEHSIGTGTGVEAVTYIELKTEGGQTVFGVGVDCNIVTAAIKALMNGVNRAKVAQENSDSVAA